MANKQPQKEKTNPAGAQKGTPQKPTQQKQAAPVLPFVFDRSNYIIMIAGAVTIMVGFLLMSGGATTDPAVFPKEEIYSFRRIGLAPIVIMIGFGIEIFAILKRPKS
jgi:hypothetical protein